MQKSFIREPIISVLGHIDHGKTTFLDYIRGSVVSSREAGGITQHIGATDVPFDTIKSLCGNLLDAIDLKIKVGGLLFIDTPGHAAFTNLRKRGGSVADIAILMVDINEGVMPQTAEAISILRQNKVPFIIAANKVDAIHGWNLDCRLDQQQKHVQEHFYNKFYQFVGQLAEHGFDADIYLNIRDFAKSVAIVPISARSGYGVPNLLMILMGLTQQYLKENLTIHSDSPAKGTILEVKEERGLGTTLDVIIYDGVIRRGDSIAVGGVTEPILTKVKALLRPKPLDEMRDPRDKFLNVKEVSAAAGVKISAPGIDDALAGSSLYVGGQDAVDALREEMEDIQIVTDQKGLILRADTIGSLEALISTLREKEIPIKKASIGKVSNTDVIEASAVNMEDKYLGVIMAFNSEVLKDAAHLADSKGITIFENKVIYQLLDDYEDWLKKEKSSDKEALEGRMTTPAKILIMPKHVFRQSKPAIVGVEVLGGALSAGSRLMNAETKIVGRVKQIQKDKESIKKAVKGDKVAVAIEGVTIGRQILEGETLYSFLSPDDVKELSEQDISEDEQLVLKEMRKLRRKKFSRE